MLLLAGRLDHPFSCSLGPWENISAGELVRCSSTREEIMAPVFGRRGPDGDLTLAKISLDSMHQSCFLAWHGQSEDGGGYSGGYGLGFSLHLPQK